MRKTFAVALSTALVGGMVLAALSGGATKRAATATLDSGADARSAARAITRTYRGKFLDAGPDTSFQVRATFAHGEATRVKSVRFRGLPADCEVSGDQIIRGSWTLAGARVNNQRRFRTAGDDGNNAHPSSVRVSGRFNRRFTKIRGKFQTTLYFPPENPPEETCVGETKRYVVTH